MGTSLNVVPEAFPFLPSSPSPVNHPGGLLPAFPEYAGCFHDAETDKLHPNARGHERMARVIAAALNAIPAEV